MTKTTPITLAIGLTELAVGYLRQAQLAGECR